MLNLDLAKLIAEGQTESFALVFGKLYVERIKTVLDQLDLKAFSRFVESIEKIQRNNGTVYFIGNGGSAATANHYANDLTFGVHADKPIKSVSLAANASTLSALANDYGYESIFEKQIAALAKTGDLVVAISASGNSENVNRAVQFAKAREIDTFALVGFDGGELLKLADDAVHIQSKKGEYGPVEDLHMILDHMLTLCLTLKNAKPKA